MTTMCTTHGKMITNHLGFKQYVDVLDEYCCPNCELQYTNAGEGILCDECGDKLEAAQNDLRIEGQW